MPECVKKASRNVQKSSRFLHLQGGFVTLKSEMADRQKEEEK